MKETYLILVGEEVTAMKLSDVKRGLIQSPEKGFMFVEAESESEAYKVGAMTMLDVIKEMLDDWK